MWPYDYPPTFPWAAAVTVCHPYALSSRHDFPPNASRSLSIGNMCPALPPHPVPSCPPPPILYFRNFTIPCQLRVLSFCSTSFFFHSIASHPIPSHPLFCFFLARKRKPPPARPTLPPGLFVFAPVCFGVYTCYACVCCVDGIGFHRWPEHDHR